MNVYLALACTLAAGVEGIVTGTDPGEPTDRDLYSMTPEEGEALGIRRLPRNLLDAVTHLQKDEVIAGVLGQTMLKSYVDYKLDEWERYHQTVTDWEVEEYLRLY